MTAGLLDDGMMLWHLGDFPHLKRNPKKHLHQHQNALAIFQEDFSPKKCP